MKIKSKKILLTLGTIAAISMPVSTVISCGVNEPSKRQTELSLGLNSAATMNIVQEKYWEMIIKSEDTSAKNWAISTGDVSDVVELKKVANFVINSHIMSDPRYLKTKGTYLLGNEAVRKQAGVTKTPIDLVVTDWKFMNATKAADLQGEGLNFLFREDKSFRREVIKKTISYFYLKNEVSKDNYKSVFMAKDKSSDPDQVFTEKQGLINNLEFNVIDEALNQHLFFNWKVSLNREESLKLQDGTKDGPILVDGTTKAVKQADLILSNKTISPAKSWEDRIKYSQTHKKVFADVLPAINNGTDTTDATNLLGFIGISPKSSNRGIMNFDIDQLKKAKKESWTGYFDKTLIKNNIKIFPQGSQIATLERVFGLMPRFDQATHVLTFDGTYFTKKDDKLLLQLINNASLYAKAEKWFFNRPTAAGKIQLEITSPVLKKNAIEHGFKFIKDPKK